jgi:hypothetical protein
LRPIVSAWILFIPSVYSFCPIWKRSGNIVGRRSHKRRVRAGTPLGFSPGEMPSGAWRLLGLASTLLALFFIN